jgi:hypothetical protein
VSEYQYYEFLALDRPLTADEQAEIREFSDEASITATSFTDEYERGDFGGDPDELMGQYYDAHLYFADWGSHRLMLRMPRKLLAPEVVGEYCVEDQVTLSTTDEHVIIDLTSEPDPVDSEDDDWEDDSEASLPDIVGVRDELAAGDLRPLYLAWLAGYGTWERDEEAFDEEANDLAEPPVPAGLGSLTAPQRAFADFLRLDSDLLEVAAEASPGSADRRTVADLLDTAALRRQERDSQEETLTAP